MASYEKRKSGWSVRFRQIINGEEKQIRLSGFATKKEAAIAYAEAIKKAPAKEPEQMRFAELFERYIAYARTNLKPQTVYEEERRVRNHIIPRFGDFAVADISPAAVAEWQADMLTVYSPEYINAIRGAFGASLRYGAEFYGLPNVLSRVRPVRDNTVKEALHVWTPEQYALFRGQLDGVLQLFFDTLYYTGMRKSEALALTPADIGAGVISISKTITTKAGLAWAVSQTKTKGSVRRISIPAPLSDRLRGRTGAFVFSLDGNSPIGTSTLDRAFRDATDKAELPRIRIHDLRHSHASFLLSSGCSIVAVSRRLGHSSVTQTLNTYAHIMPADDAQIMAILEKM